MAEQTKLEINPVKAEPTDAEIQSRVERYRAIYNRIILQTPEQFKKESERIVWLLKRFPPTRGDDRLLTFRYWSEFQGLNFPRNFWDEIELNGEPTKFFKSLASGETLTRIRRKVQYEWGIRDILPSEEVLRKRGIREPVIRMLMRGEPAMYCRELR
jgi:hypothetical protein